MLFEAGMRIRALLVVVGLALAPPARADEGRYYKVVTRDLKPMYGGNITYTEGKTVTEPTGHGLYYFAGLWPDGAVVEGLGLGQALGKGESYLMARDLSFRLIEVEPIGKRQQTSSVKFKAPALRVLKVFTPAETAQLLLDSRSPSAKALGLMMLDGSPELMKKLGHKVNVRDGSMNAVVRWNFYRHVEKLVGTEVKNVHDDVMFQKQPLRGTIQSVDAKTRVATIRTRTGLRHVNLFWLKPVKPIGRKR